MWYLPLLRQCDPRACEPALQAELPELIRRLAASSWYARTHEVAPSRPRVARKWHPLKKTDRPRHSNMMVAFLAAL